MDSENTAVIIIVGFVINILFFVIAAIKINNSIIKRIDDGDAVNKKELEEFRRWTIEIVDRLRSEFASKRELEQVLERFLEISGATTDRLDKLFDLLVRHMQNTNHGT